MVLIVLLGGLIYLVELSIWLFWLVLIVMGSLCYIIVVVLLCVRIDVGFAVCVDCYWVGCLLMFW